MIVSCEYQSDGCYNNSQLFQSFEIAVVDNESTKGTLIPCHVKNRVFAAESCQQLNLAQSLEQLHVNIIHPQAS